MSISDGSAPWRAHGGLSDRARAHAGLVGGPLIDFSVNVNPYGPTEEMVAAVRAAPLDRYPDDGAWAARQALAALWGVPAGEIVLANGAADLLWLLARVLVPPGAHALVAEPTFGEFRAAVAATPGTEVHVWRASQADDFRFDPVALSAAVTRSGARAVYLCSPNNPTGAYLGPGPIATLAARHPDTTLVIDQAFLSLSDHFADATAARPANVVWVRSLTKDHAIPGLRVGAAIVSAPLAARLEAARASWSTSAGAQLAAIAAAREQGFIVETRARWLADRRVLEQQLAALQIRCVPSSTIFVLARFSEAAALAQRLLHRHRILVRDTASFGLPDYLRLAARPEGDRRALIAALGAELSGQR